MFNQARGGLAALLYQREPSFRTPPETPNAVQLPFTSYGLFRNPNKTRDPSVSASPLPGKSGCGDATVEGPIKSILDLRTIGYWLALLLGVPTAYKAVTKQPTNVLGVTVHYAENSAGSGDGTLAYTHSGTTLTWTDQGGTPGTPVDVSAGGRFTLAAGTASHGIVVEVAAAALPTADKTDADIAVSATLKAHVFPFDLADRPTALLERAHSDIGKFLRVSGALVGKLGYDLTAREQNIDMTLLAGAETVETSTWDATPTVHDSVRPCGHGGFIGNGSTSALGTVTGGTLSCDIGAQGMKVANQQEGYGLIDFGEIALGGTLKAVFDGASAWEMARNSTSTRLRLGSMGLAGSDAFALWWDIPNAELSEKSMPLEGKSGLFVELDWQAHRDAAGNLPLVTLINDVAGY